MTTPPAKVYIFKKKNFLAKKNLLDKKKTFFKVLRTAGATGGFALSYKFFFLSVYFSFFIAKTSHSVVFHSNCRVSFFFSCITKRPFLLFQTFI
jgi:hypothetical protein